MQWVAHGECELPPTTEWLSERESAQVASIRFTKRRSEYLTRRWTAKHAVATVLGLDHSLRSLATVEVRNRETGAPYVEVEREPAAIDLSLSDRAGWAVCLVGPPGSAAAGSLGIDLEVVESRTDRFVTDFFTAVERDYVMGLAAGEPRDEAANLIWSAKEAALKLRQVGLRADTRTVEVSVDRTARPRRLGSTGGHRVERRPDARLVATRRRVPVDHRVRRGSRPAPATRRRADLARAEPLHSWVDQPVV